jgi:predicted O-methyltransferase YrrM
MKILMIDQAGFQLQTRKMLLEDAIHECSVECASTLGEVFTMFQKDKYDVVVIDHGIENGQQCVDHILSNSPMQSILVVSDAIHCVIRRCEDCVNNHLIRRLFNPTPIKNIVRMVEGFRNYACDHYDAETNKL